MSTKRLFAAVAMLLGREMVAQTETVSERRRSFLLTGVLLALSVLYLSNCSGSGKDAMVGKWQCGVYLISIYEDGLASVSSVKASWKHISGGVLVEFQDGESTIAASLTLGDPEKDGLRTATLDMGYFEIACRERASES